MRTFDKDETDRRTHLKTLWNAEGTRRENAREKPIEWKNKEMAQKQERVDTANPDELLLAVLVHSTIWSEQEFVLLHKNDL